MRTWLGYNIFKFLSDLISTYLGFAEAGYEFLFGMGEESKEGKKGRERASEEGERKGLRVILINSIYIRIEAN
jgi:hypothetical protein